MNYVDYLPDIIGCIYVSHTITVTSIHFMANIFTVLKIPINRRVLQLKTGNWGQDLIRRRVLSKNVFS